MRFSLPRRWWFFLSVVLLVSTFPTKVFADADDVQSGATTFNLNASYAGSISTNDTVDWWKILVSALGDLQVNLDVPCNADFDLELYQGSTFVKGSYGPVCGDETVRVTMNYSGWYYVKVYRYSGAGSYGLSATVIPPPTVDKAAFVSETISDGTDFYPNTSFTKTWTIRNSGTSTWNSNYYLEYVGTNFSGTLSTSQSIRRVGVTVSPGYQYTFSIPMQSPGSTGTGFREDWRLRGPNGVINVDSSPTVWALIDVVSPPNNPPNDCTLVSPSNGESNQPLTTLLDWACTDPDAGDNIVDYYLQLDDNIDFSSPLKNGTIGSATSSWRPSNNGISLANGTTYYWRVYGKDSQGAISQLWTRWSFTTVSPPIDLAPYTPSGWSAPIVASGVTGTNQDGTLYACLPAYLDFAFQNSGNGSTSNTFYNYILIDGSNVYQWVKSGIASNGSATLVDYNVSNISAGWHTVTLSADATGLIQESSDSNNSFSKSFYWNACNSPVAAITNPSNGSATTSSPISVTGTCSDTDGNLASVTLKNETTGGSGATNISGSQATFSTSMGLNPGLNTLSATCLDSFGASSRASVSVDYAICSDGSSRDGIGDPCNHNEDGDGRLDSIDTCPFDPDDSINDPCNHDEDGDGIPDVVDACPFYPNDTIGDACNPNDNGNLVFSGDPVRKTLTEGSVDQTQQFRVTNTGTGPLVYSLSKSVPTPPVTLVKNGGETDAFTKSQHVLNPGATDIFTFLVDATSFQVGNSTIMTDIRLTSNDVSEGSATIPVDVNVEKAPYCPAILSCQVPPASTLGNQTPTVQNVSDPINTATGNYAYHHTDLALVGRGLSLNFSRTYNSQDHYLGPLGFGWTHTFNIFLVESESGDIQIKWGDGHYEGHTKNTDGTFTPPLGLFSTLTKNQDASFDLVTKDKILFRFSAGGQLTKILDRNGNELAFSYDTQKRLKEVSDLTGKKLIFAYLDSDPFKIASVSDHKGRVVQFVYSSDDMTRFTDVGGAIYQYNYDTNHQLASVIDPRGNTLVTNKYDDFGRVIEQKDAKNNVTGLAFETPEAGKVTVTDPLGQTTKQVYDSHLRVIENQDPSGRAIVYEYNPQNLRTKVTDRNNHPLTAAYDSKGNLVSLTDPSGVVTRFEYDSATNDLVKVLSPNGHERNFEYDGEGNRTRVWEMIGSTLIETLYTYNEWGQVTKIVDPLGNATSFSYDATGNLTSITDAEGGIARFTHDDLGRVLSVSDPQNRKTQYTYDAKDRFTQTADPKGQTIQLEYDANGSLKKFTNKSGISTEFQYNTNDFLERTLNSLGHETTVAYDALNRQKSITDPEGRTVQFTYDANGNVETVTDPSGRVTRYQYDVEGNRTSLTDTAGQSWSYSYDALGRLAEGKDPLGNVTTYQYDPKLGTPTQIQNAAGKITQFLYDEIGRPTTVVDTLGGRTSYSYDQAGRLKSVTNPAGKTTAFNYDKAGRLKEEKNALNENTQYVYYSDGLPQKFIDGKGQVAQYTYDELARLSDIQLADGTSQSFTYDANGNRLTRVDSLGTAQYTYDVLNRLAAVKDARGFEIGYQYDATGLLKKLTYPGGKVVDYVYNPSRQLTTVTDWLGNVTRYNYDTAGRLSKTVLPNQFETTYAYDLDSRLIQLINKKPDGTTLSRYDFALGPTGNRTKVVKEEPLTPWIVGVNETATYNDENAILNLGSLDFEYDANGNLTLTIDGSQQSEHQWDALDRLSQITTPNGVTNFSYDGDGNRVAVVAAGQTKQFIVDPNRSLPDVIAETAAAGSIQNYYVYGLGLIGQASADGSQIRYHHYDPTGSTIALSDDSGSITDQYVYDEFGGLNRKTGNTANPFQFVGQFGVQSDSTGLYYMRARYYDPKAGRFVSRDPIGFAGGMNLYEYVGNNPVSNVDPSGNIIETPWDVANVGLGAVSLGYNIAEGSWGWAALDVLGLIYDVTATAVPFLPAGAGAGIKVLRTGAKVVDAVDVGMDVARVADKAHDAARTADITTNALQEGTKIHRQVGNVLESSGSLSSSARNAFSGSNGARGLAPDLTWGNTPRIWADLTTPNAWSSHVIKYGDEFGEGIPLIYERGKGLVNTPRLYPGAGTALTVTQSLSGGVERSDK